MDKISGIIKSSPRIQAVDIRESTGLRPGTPAFGRAENISSLAKNDLAKNDLAKNDLAKNELAKADLEAPLSLAKKATAVNEELAGWKAKDQMRASIAAELSNKFFSRMPTAAEEPVTPTPTPMALPMRIEDRPSNPSGFKTDLGMSSKMMNFNALPDPGPALAQPEGLFPRGSFIDRIA